MSTLTSTLLEMWTESRTRFTKQLDSLQAADLIKTLPPSPNSVGFLIRHMGDVEWLFAKNVFGASELKVSAKTVIAGKDTGEWTDLEALKTYVRESFEALKAIVAQQSKADWQETVSTKEFGSKTKAEAFGRIVSHTAYHAGQMALIIKYGTAQHA